MQYLNTFHIVNFVYDVNVQKNDLVLIKSGNKVMLTL